MNTRRQIKVLLVEDRAEDAELLLMEMRARPRCHQPPRGHQRRIRNRAERVRAGSDPIRLHAAGFRRYGGIADRPRAEARHPVHFRLRHDRLSSRE